MKNETCWGMYIWMRLVPTAFLKVPNLIERSVWPDQPQQDRGTAYSCCKHHTHGAKHQHRWHADGNCRQLQVGSIISNDGYLEKKIKSKISKASQALGRLRTKVLNHHNICLFTKLKVYRTVILTFLLRYGCETWILYRSHVSSLPDSELPDWVCRATSDDT